MTKLVDDITGRCIMLKPRHVSSISYRESKHGDVKTYDIFVDFANGNSISITKFRNQEVLDCLESIMKVR